MSAKTVHVVIIDSEEVIRRAKKALIYKKMMQRASSRRMAPGAVLWRTEYSDGSFGLYCLIWGPEGDRWTYHQFTGISRSRFFEEVEHLRSTLDVHRRPSASPSAPPERSENYARYHLN